MRFPKDSLHQCSLAAVHCSVAQFSGLEMHALHTLTMAEGRTAQVNGCRNRNEDKDNRDDRDEEDEDVCISYFIFSVVKTLDMHLCIWSKPLVVLLVCTAIKYSKLN